MRVTNNMITENTKTNINSNKVLVDKYNTQMTTHKKIAKASEDPVIAIRALRMQTNMSHIEQYLDHNISEVNAWLEVTGTALSNMKSILTDIRTQCNNGSTDTLNEDDRQTILKSLNALADQVYTEGNSDYAGRTVFTGYRTGSKLTFMEDEKATKYAIDQTFDFKELHDHRYYYGDTTVPADADTPCTTQIGTSTYSRLRLAYDKIDGLGDTLLNPENETPFSYTYTDSDGNVLTKAPSTDDPLADGDYSFKVYADEDEWLAANSTLDADNNIDTTKGKIVGDNEVVLIKSTGELIFGNEIAHTIAQKEATVNVTYTRTGFSEGEVRPEYYYDCRKINEDLEEPVTLMRTDGEGNIKTQLIDFTISSGITISANTEAHSVFDTAIARDVQELVDVVSRAINAHTKVERITEMMHREQYVSDEDQAVLQTYLDAAKKEMDYADDNMQKTYSQYITNFDNYLEKVNIALTNVGSLEKRLDLTKTRVENQKMTVEELQSNNEDRDISDIIIDYYASYNAYTASLTAAAKVGEQTLLNYI